MLCGREAEVRAGRGRMGFEIEIFEISELKSEKEATQNVQVASRRYQELVRIDRRSIKMLFVS